jgi:phage tail-like protein
MATGDRKDPYRGYNFRIEIDSIQRAGFRECSGLDTTSAPIDYREGTDGQYSPRKLPGQSTYANITLKGGITDDAGLWDWRKKVIDGKTERKNVSIVLINESGEDKLRWNFINAWPTQWTGPGFNASENQVAIETLVIVHEGMNKA